jgi:hypothetical protein
LMMDPLMGFPVNLVELDLTGRIRGRKDLDGNRNQRDLDRS